MTGLPIANAGTQRDRQAAQRALTALADLERGTHQIMVGQTRVRVSKLDKVLYPEFEFTKLDLLRSYMQLAPVLLAHARARPLTTKQR